MGAVTSLFVRKMIAAADAGADTDLLLASVGLSPEPEPDPRHMVSADAYYALLEDVAARQDVTTLPLRVGASMRCDDYGALGLAFKSAPTLEGSFKRVCRYARLWTSVVEYALTPADQDTTWYDLHRSGPRRLGLRLSNETTLAATLAIAREVAPDGRVTPVEVLVRHKAPGSTAAHTRFFGCPVHFDAGRDAIRFSNDTLARGNRLGDEGITRFLLGHLDQALAEITKETSLGDRTRDAIARSLSEGLPRMEDIAVRLGFSVRSLHRRLADDGLTFQMLAEETRRELAMGLLREERYAISEIAFLTGFSEQSAFNRAFKRWNGSTPTEFRKSLGA